MAERAESQPHINWIAAGAIGAVSLGFGIYLLIDSDNATQLIGAIIAFALLLASLVHLLQGFRRDGNEFAARAALLSGGVGATVGAIVTLDIAYDYLTSTSARVILASGLIVYGVLGIAGIAVNRKDGGQLRTILASAFALAFAALLIYNSRSAELESRWFAIGLIIVGLILLGVAALSHRQRDAALQRAAAGGSSPAAVSGERRGVPGLGRRGETDSGTGRKIDPSRPADRPTGSRPPGVTQPTPAATGATSRSRPSSEAATPAGSAAQPRMGTPAEGPSSGSSSAPTDLPDDHNFDPFTGERVRPTDKPTTGDSPTRSASDRGPFTPQRP